MTKVAKRLAATSLVRPRPWKWIALGVVAILALCAVLLFAYLGYF